MQSRPSFVARDTTRGSFLSKVAVLHACASDDFVRAPMRRMRLVASRRRMSMASSLTMLLVSVHLADTRDLCRSHSCHSVFVNDSTHRHPASPLPRLARRPDRGLQSQ